MELTLTVIIYIVLGALICEFIDSSLGMLYGTVLSPVLIIAGFSPLLIVPSILFSQAIGGLTASMVHHHKKNVDFSVKSPEMNYMAQKLKNSEHKDFAGQKVKKSLGVTLAAICSGIKTTIGETTSRDLKVSLCITFLGILATVFAALVAVNIPKAALTTYIGVLVLAMGAILLSKASFKFSWKKITAIGILSAFNKSMSGGGFGPLVTAGQVIGGRDGKSSIGATTLAEAPICIAGFLTYLLARGIADWKLVAILSTGAFFGALIGPHFTAKFKSEKRLKLILGFLVIGLGIWTLAKTWLI